VKLSHADAKEVIEKGWGERHGLSRKTVLSGKTVRSRTFTAGYLMIYAPRNEGEVRLWARY
jgi:hypothetical protein